MFFVNKYYQLLESKLLSAYEDKSSIEFNQASQALKASLFALFIQSLILILHFFYSWELSHIIADLIILFCFAYTLPLLKSKKLSQFAFIYLVGSFLMIFIHVIFRDHYYNTPELTSPFHIFQTSTLLLMCIGYFTFLLNRSSKVLFLSFLGILLISIHAVVLQLKFPESSAMFYLYAVAVLEFVTGVFGIYYATKYFNQLTENLEIKNNIIEEKTQALIINEEKLKASNKDLETFAYAISHDLKQPMRTMSSFTGLLDREVKKEIPDQKKIDIYTKEIIDGNKRMNSMIVTLLDFAKLEIEENQLVNIDLNDTVSIVKKNLHSQITDRKASIKSDNLPVIKASSDLMVQLFQNIISNAIKYCEKCKSPKIFIKAEKIGMAHKISISDNGPGIDASFLTRIFDIFSRADFSDNEGTGLGLSICKRIIELHDGTIEVESELGNGSTFVLNFPK